MTAKRTLAPRASRTWFRGCIAVVAMVAGSPAWAHAASWKPPPSAAMKATVDPLGQGLVVRMADSVPEGSTIRAWIEERGYAVLGRREPQAYRPTAFGVASSLGLGLGARLLVGGAAIEASEHSATHSWSRGGLAIVGIGSEMLLGGVTMLVMDAIRCKRSPERCRDHTRARGSRG